MKLKSDLILLSTPLTRTIQFDTLDEMGVDLYRPIFSEKTKLILGYPMTGKPSRKTTALKIRQANHKSQK